MENYLGFHQTLEILRKHSLFIIISIVSCLLIALGIEKIVLVPRYTSTTQILVNQKGNTSTSGAAFQDQQADVQMISTYKDIITNQVVLHQAQQKLANSVKIISPARKAEYHINSKGHRRLVRAPRPAIIKPIGRSYNVSIQSLQNAISISNQQNSQVFALNAESNNPNKSAAIANAVATAFKQRIGKIMSVNNVTILSKASPNYKRTFPKTYIIILAGVFVGALIGLGYAFIREMIDTTIKDDEFLTTYLKLINLGHVSEIKKIKGSHLAKNQYIDHSDHHKRRV